MQAMRQCGIEFVVNRAAVAVAWDNPRTTLLDALRDRGLTGAKEGCAEGECGACTVAMVEDTSAGVAYVPVNSCLVLLPMAAGREIITVEGLAEDGSPSEVQRAMATRGGSQCGYCTPGFVMSMFAEQYRPGRRGPCRIEALEGNLCRCTGYRPIRDAALSLGPAPEGRLRERLSRAAPEMGAFKCEGEAGPGRPAQAGRPAPLFMRPCGLDECLGLMESYPEARLIAGGTDLVVESNLKARRLDALVTLISVDGIEELRVFRDADDYVEIGAGLSLNEIAARWSAAPAAFREWLLLFASPLLRNRATLGGNLATASPIGDGAPLLLAYGAELRIAGLRGERTAPLKDFFLAYRKTALEAGELIRSIVLPKPLPSYARFYKAAKRRSDDISTVAAGFAIDVDAAGTVTRARLAFGGVAATPVRAVAAERELVGRSWDLAAVKAAQDVLARTFKPISDHRGSAEYRLALAQSLLEKLWEDSLAADERG
jgi:xanthine dehydrogenase small subunit